MSAAGEPATGRRLRVLSGFRPTGPMHIGHLVGALENWVRLQDTHDCFFAICDWHALTSEYADTSPLKDHVLDMAIDWLAAGLDPDRCTIFVQSHVPEHAELHLLLSMIVPVAWLERVPTYKEQQQQITHRDLTNYGFLGYPVLQAADILIYRAERVPVGEDQLAHLELCREIARRFNSLYGEVFPEPQALTTRVPRVPGTDGRKMSKSYGNAVNLGDPLPETRQKILKMVTDPARKTRKDPGNPDVCPVYDLHKAFSDRATIDLVDLECRRAGIGCIDCKNHLLRHLEPVLIPIQERRARLMNDRERVRAVLEDGARRARAEAAVTMSRVRTAMKIDTRASG
ncbi:MAG TPA: tryptophan--tRNA ligase [Candidatus Polarisedimenticolia bacterium]|nr:tryptophan--tRNA ligase [Candidatus Polarisedimenticolia bacterium]